MTPVSLRRLLLALLVPIHSVGFALPRGQRNADTVALYYRSWSASSRTLASSAPSLLLESPADRLARPERACKVHDCAVSFPHFFKVPVLSVYSSSIATRLGLFTLLLVRQLSYLIRCLFVYVTFVEYGSQNHTVPQFRSSEYLYLASILCSLLEKPRARAGNEWDRIVGCMWANTQGFPRVFACILY
ncbi:hypothetical protein F5888DRAFT_563278 [Russula emetica]|nr:hypothetical protein F5888DRAFT_563278 [Russula emetica]